MTDRIRTIVTRRRSLGVLAAVAGGFAFGDARARNTFRWTGTAMGAKASIILADRDITTAELSPDGVRRGVDPKAGAVEEHLRQLRHRCVIAGNQQRGGLAQRHFFGVARPGQHA